MPGPIKSQVHIDTLLTGVSIGYVQSQDNFVADKVAPIFPVNKSSDKYPIWDAASFLRMQTVETSRYAPAPEATFTASNDTYTCEEWPLKKLILDKDRKDADVNIEMAAVKFLTQQILMRREYQVINKLFTSGNWTNSYTGAAAAADFVHFSDSSSTPFATVRAYARVAQLAAGGFKPNTIVTTGEVDDYLKEHDDTLDKVKYTQMGVATNDLLAKAFDVDNYLVCNAVRNTAAAGQTATLANIGGDFLWIGYVSKTPSEFEPSAMYNFSWKDYDAGGKGGALIKRWRSDDPEGDWLKAEAAFDPKVTAAGAGVLLINPATG